MTSSFLEEVQHERLVGPVAAREIVGEVRLISVDEVELEILTATIKCAPDWNQRDTEKKT